MSFAPILSAWRDIAGYAGLQRARAPKQIRLLLTAHCSAHCAYCHNEGQPADRRFLETESLFRFLDGLDAQGIRVGEIVLSGGEPTLHPHVAEIARRCRASAAWVSINTHGGHPKRLARVLPWVDEVKLHVDSFDAIRQRQRMGVDLAKVRASIALAQSYAGLRLLLNHPVASIEDARTFLLDARHLGIDCKLIALQSASPSSAPDLRDLPWEQMGYRQENASTWLHKDGRHRVYERYCVDPADKSLFVGPDGARRSPTASF